MRKNYPREVPSYQLREHRRSLSAMRGGDSDAREKHHDIHTGESVRCGPPRYNNVTPGLARAQPGRCTPHRRRANAMRYTIVNPLTLSLSSPRFAVVEWTAWARWAGSNPCSCDSPSRARPTAAREKRERERARRWRCHAVAIRTRLSPT